MKERLEGGKKKITTTAKPAESRKDDTVIRYLSFFVLVAVVTADYLGYKSKYSDYVLGLTAVTYLFGRRSMLTLVSIYMGKKLDMSEEEIKKIVE